jgi:hypothetical protein
LAKAEAYVAASSLALHKLHGQGAPVGTLFRSAFPMRRV